MIVGQNDMMTNWITYTKHYEDYSIYTAEFPFFNLSGM